jgi:hypothetical protein
MDDVFFASTARRGLAAARRGLAAARRGLAAANIIHL